MPIQIKTLRSDTQSAHLRGMPEHFRVPGPSGLSGIYDLLPAEQAYDFEDVYKGQSGEASLISDRLDTNPVIVHVLQLETAKKIADNTSNQLVAAGSDEEFRTAGLNATHAQRSVCSNRIALLKVMCDQFDQIELCQETTDNYQQKEHGLCVTYTKFSSSGDEILHQMQSEYSWALNSQDTVVWASFIHSNDHAENSKRLHAMLHRAATTCPQTRWTTGLRALLHDHMDQNTSTPVFIHQFNHVALEAQWQKSEASSKPFQAYSTTKRDGNKVVEFMGMASVMDLNVCDHKQSAYIRRVVKSTILDVARKVVGDSSQKRSNLFQVSIKICADDETHILTFKLFAGPEECTVSHVTCAQPMPAPHDRAARQGVFGILHINEPQITDIRSLPHGTLTHPTSFTRIGAYRQVRFNEQELNYIHMFGLTDGGMTSQDFPADAFQINYDMFLPPAKAVRISGAGWDVLATSYIEGSTSQVMTTITSINYPPYGTQIDHTRMKKNGGQTAPPQRKKGWGEDSQAKTFYVRGVVGSPLDKKNNLQFIQGDSTDGAALRAKYQKHLVELKDTISRTYTSVWQGPKFYENLANNSQKPAGQTHTMGEMWSSSWQKIIGGDIRSWYDRSSGTFKTPGDQTRWITDGDGVNIWSNIIGTDELSHIWMTFLLYFDQPGSGGGGGAWGDAQSALTKRADTIKLPPRPLAKSVQSKPAPELTQMQARIRALEAKLDQSRQDGNNTHLLQQVLSKLERPSALRY
jgi:hypothetical protein